MMPGLFTHFAILDNVVQNKNANINQATRQILGDPVMQKYANWGAVGPDYLFFHPDDWPEISGFMKFYYQFDDLTNEISEVMSSAKEMFGSDESSFKNRLSGGLYNQLISVVESIMANVTIRLAEVSLGHIYDLFGRLRPPMNEFAYIKDAPGGFDNRRKWWWMDIGHHTRTSQFMQNLWKEAESWQTHRNDNRLKAYAYGYLSHIGGDVIGHPYVNLLVGGPYRNHWRRHSLVEKCLDTYIWKKAYNRELLSSYDIVEEKLLIKNPSFEHFLMPEDVASSISRCLDVTYSKLNILSGIPSTEYIQMMFSYTYRYLKSTTSKSLFNLPPPPEDFDWWDIPEEYRNTLDRLKEKPPEIYDPGKNFKDFSVLDWKKFLKSLFDHIGWIVETIRLIVTIPLHLLARVTLTGSRYMVYLLLNQLYQLYASSRLVLVTGAYAHPDLSQLKNNFGHIFTIKEDWLGKYPYKATYNGASKVMEKMQTYHLLHPHDFSNPSGGVEEPSKTSPFYLAGQVIPPEKYLLDFLPGATWSDLDQSKSLAETDQLRQIAMHENPLSASDLTVALFNKYEKDGGFNLPDWNLDGDRGLGWPEWATNKSTDSWSVYNDFLFKDF